MFVNEIQKDKWIGAKEASDKPLKLRAGKLSMEFVLGRLTNISLGGKNVIDEVYFALRDYNWGTIPYMIENFTITQKEDAFAISFTAIHNQDSMHFNWNATITGSTDSIVTYSFDGIAKSDFKKNRIGFCVLHPASCSGVDCEVEHFNSEAEKASFPVEISPSQPFFDIKAITHQPAKGVVVRVDFEGDVFEMEDQRNWTDASFKTYCTPLALPFPALVKMGDRFRQTVTISLQSEPGTEDVKASEDEAVLLLSGRQDRRGRRFSLGSCIKRPLTDLQMQRTKELKLSQLRYDYHFSDSSECIKKIFEQARVLGLKIQLAVFFTENWKTEIETLRAVVGRYKKDIMGLAIFQQNVKVVSEELLVVVREKLTGYAVSIGSGTDAFFTQINRQRLPERLLDFVSYSSNPQVHAFDNESIMSTVEGQAATTFSCAGLYPHLPIWLSPVSMKMRWNPDATGIEIIKKSQVPRDVDIRQMSLFAASWFLRSIAAAINSGAVGANYFELVGSKGIMDEDAPNRDYTFSSVPDMLFPLYYAFFALRGLNTFYVTASIYENATILVLRNKDRMRLILANSKNAAVIMKFADVPSSIRGVMLDEDSMPKLARKELFSTDDDNWKTYNLNGEIRLKPYSIFIAEI